MHVLIPGSFDPITQGHMALIWRAAGLFGRVTVGIFQNADKKCLFSPAERAALAAEAVKEIPGVDVVTSDGYVVDYCRSSGVRVLVRGLRDEKDLPFEKLAEEYNRTHGVETVFLLTDPALAAVSSSRVRERLQRGEVPTDMIPAASVPLLASFLADKGKNEDKL